jgi:Ca2+-dependent lipid-binding protein
MTEKDKLINKYNHGKIYTIRCSEDNDLIYIGSSIQPLHKRWHQHKERIYNQNDKEYNKLLYIKIRELGIDKFYIELYENFKCENKEELRKREGEIIRQLGTLNKYIAGRTKKEWNQDNKEKETERLKNFMRKEKIKCMKYI